jgi:alkanesulfonate monooxygenase SsuD/methylene tetrahydromethanopterin reductase-like flavin-dependent oxidoreductase (luciferase family)
MPYRELPEDFEQRTESVWVTPPAELFDPARAHMMYNATLDELEHAARLGLDGVCVNEHHQNAYGLMASPNLMAAALARRTTDAALVVLGNTLALYHPPLRVAEEYAMLDCISGGRLVAGFTVGTSMDTNYCYGIPPATLRERFFEAHDLILQAWTRPEVFSFNGRYTKLRYVNIWPRPLQQPHPPVWVPGSGSIETWEWTIRHDHVYCYLSFYGYANAERMVQGFWEQVAKMGVEPNPYRFGFLQLVAVAETDAQAQADYEEHIRYFYRKCLHVAPRFAEAPGYRTAASIRYGTGAFGRISTAERMELTWKDYVDRGMVIAGSPATVRERLADAIQKLRVGHLMVLLQIGSMPHHLTLKNIELFAREVYPYLRGTWDDQWQDHWWIKPVAAPATPAALRG